MSSRMSFEPSSLMADQRYGQHASPMELGLCRKLRGVADDSPQQLRSLAMELLEALKDECGGGTAMIMVSRFAMGLGPPDCEVRHSEPGSKDGLACALWFELGAEDDSKQTAFIRHGPDEPLLARTLFRWSGGAAPLPLPVLDTHVHFYDVERPGGVPWPPPGNKLLYRTVQPEHLTELASSWGLAGCIAVECSPIVADNAQLLELAAASPVVRGVVGGGIEIGSKTFAEDVDKFAEHPKFVGIRARALPFLESIESLEAPKESYFGDLEHLAVHELSLDLIGPATDTGTVVGHRGRFSPKSLRVLAQVAKRYPTLHLIVNHTAGVPVNGEEPEPEWLRAMQQLAEQPNVYIKLSGHMEASTVQPAPTALRWYLPLFRALWSLFGRRDRLFYGSNWPVCDRAPGVAAQIVAQGRGSRNGDAKPDAAAEPEPEPEPEPELEPEPEPEPEPPYLTQLRLTQQFFDLLDSEGGDEDPALQYERRAKFYWDNAMAAYRCPPLADPEVEAASESASEPEASADVGD